MSSSSLLQYFKELPSTAIVAFVKQQKEMSERMKNVYQKIKEITDVEIRRMSEEEILNYNNTLLNNFSHIFVLENFSGSSYDHLLSKKAGKFKIYGVLLLERMFEDDITVTNYWRIHNNTFQDLKICTSNLNSVEKGKIENLVKSMNGSFTNELSSDVTHLITNSTKTVKYSDAANLDIPIYHTEWINHVWNKCQKQDNVPKANSEQYDVFKLPPLFDLKISATGMSKDQRNEISEIIEENGGKFEEIFKSNTTDILIMDKQDSDNSKFKIASKYKIPVLNINWIHESVKAGYALSYNDFAFKRPKSFDSSSSSINESATNLSTEEPKKVEETKEKKEEPAKSPNNVLTDKTNEQFLSTYTIGQAKKLGHIFDGYSFFLYNFPLEYYLKVGKLISTCGGIRITELDQSITHILCFDKENLEDFHKKTVEKEFHGCMIDYKWFVECLKQGKLLSETDYIITVNSSSSKKLVPPSPLSRKAIHSLNMSITKANDESKKENAKALTKHQKKEPGTSSKMLDFSNQDDLIQTSIEANHKKLKQAPNIVVSRKRSYEGDLSLVDEVNKRRKVSDDADRKNSFQVL